MVSLRGADEVREPKTHEHRFLPTRTKRRCAPLQASVLGFRVCRFAASRNDAERVIGPQGGFTLLEMTVVLCILALCLGVAIPKFQSGTGPAGLRTMARSVASELRLARSTAIGKASTARFVLDIPQHRFGIDGQAGHPIPNDIKLAVTTADTEVNPNGVATLSFFPDGSSIGGKITLQAKSGRYEVAINWLTGGVQINGPLQ